jgi:hypothetical protein
MGSFDRKWLFLLPNANHTGTPPHHLLDSLSLRLGLMVPYGWIGNTSNVPSLLLISKGSIIIVGVLCGYVLAVGFCGSSETRTLGW